MLATPALAGPSLFSEVKEKEIRYFEPFDAGTVTIPDVRIVSRKDGREFILCDPPFQSMREDGLQGSIIALKPEEEKTCRYERSRFLRWIRRAAAWTIRSRPACSRRVRAAGEPPGGKSPPSVSG